jgi:hypothetical protein
MSVAVLTGVIRGKTIELEQEPDLPDGQRVSVRLDPQELPSTGAGSSRAAASLEPMDLSESDASAIERALASGSARPRIKVAPLPQYEG